MQQKWIAGYTGRCPGTQINYQAVGSGQGIQTFGAGQIDFAGSDVTMKPDEQAAADKRCGSTAIHIPVTAGGVAVTWNLPGVSQLKFSPNTLAKIFQGKIKTWDDAAIKADNPGVALPGVPITVVYRSDASGTNAVFTSYLAAAAPKAWTLGSGKTVQWPTGQGAAKNQGVSAAVAQTPGAITYTEQGFAEQHKLPTAQVKNGAGQYVALSATTVSQALTAATVRPASAGDLTTHIDFQPRQGYPISTVSYVIVCTTYPASFHGVDLLKSYLRYATTTGQQAANSLGFAPLPMSLQTKAESSIAGIR
jgi:phosphate transport system substrate-binding protein